MLLNIFNTGITYTAAIIEDALGYVQSGLDWIASQAGWLQLVVYALVAILVLVGLFTILKKAIKAILVIAVLGAIVYVLDMQGIINLQSIIDQVTGLFSALIFKGTII